MGHDIARQPGSGPEAQAAADVAGPAVSFQLPTGGLSGPGGAA